MGIIHSNVEDAAVDIFGMFMREDIMVVNVFTIDVNVLDWWLDNEKWMKSRI